VGTVDIQILCLSFACPHTQALTLGLKLTV